MRAFRSAVFASVLLVSTARTRDLAAQYGAPASITITPANGTTRHNLNPMIYVEYSPGGNCMVGDPNCWPPSVYIALNGNDITSSFSVGDYEATNGSGLSGANNFQTGSNTIYAQACNGYGCIDVSVSVTLTLGPQQVITAVRHPSVEPTASCNAIPFAPGASLGCAGWFYGHANPGYVALGATRTAGIVYSSRVAAERALASINLQMAWDAQASRVETWFKNPNHGSHVYWDGTAWDSTAGNVTRRMVMDLPIDTLWSGVTAARKADTLGVQITTVAGVTGDSLVDSLPIYILRDSTTTPIARGWGIAGLTRIYASQGPQVSSAWDSTWSVLIASPDGGAAYFKRTGTSGSVTSYTRPAGVLASLTSSSTGTWFKVLDIGGGEAYYSWVSSLGYARLDSSVINGAKTSVSYRSGTSGSPSNITDPTGNNSVRFAYSGSGVGKLDSICAPSGGNQQCTTIHYTTAGGETAVDYITDPDGVNTTFGYNTSFAHPLINAVTPRARGTYTVLFESAVPHPKAIILPGSDTLTYLAPQLVGRAAAGTGSSGTPATPAVGDYPFGYVRSPLGMTAKFAANRFGAVSATRDTSGHVMRAHFTAEGEPDTLVVDGVVKQLWSYNGLGGATSHISVGQNNTTLQSIEYDAGCASYPCRVDTVITTRSPLFTPDTVLIWYEGSTTLVDSTYQSGAGKSYLTREGSGFRRVLTATDPKGHRSMVRYESTWGNVDTVLSDTARVCAGCALRQDTTVITVTGQGRTLSAKHGNAGARVTMEYDAVGRPTKQRTVEPGAADSIVTQTIYDDANRTVTVRDGLSHDIVFLADTRGRMTVRTDAAGQKDSLFYDGDGRVTRSVNRRNQAITYTYDAMGRLRTKTLPGSQVSTYGYNATWGALDTLTTPDVSLYRTRNSLGQLWQERTVVNGHSRTLELTHDESTGMLTGYNDPWNGSFTLGGDAATRTRTITNMVGQTFTTYYATDGTVDSIGYPSGGNTTFTRNALRQPLTAGVGGEITYAMDTLFRLDSVTYNSFVQTFTHDNYGRLASETMSSLGPGSESFTYDKAGNRSGTGYRYVSNSNAQRHHASIGGDSYASGDSLEYDPAGNPTFWRNETSGAYDSLAWDAEGRLTRIRRYNAGNNLVTDVSYKYDGLGRRSMASGTNVTNRLYVWNGWDLLGETDTAGTLTREYTYNPDGIDQPLAVGDAGGSHWLRLDAQGNVYRVDNTSGTAQSQYRYRAWGDRYDSITANYASRLTYKAREEDPETGLIYMRNRYYSPRLERFVNEDPIGISGGLNTYAFASDAPHMRSDPSGLRPGCRLYITTVTTVYKDGHEEFMGRSYDLQGDDCSSLWAMDGDRSWRDDMSIGLTGPGLLMDGPTSGRIGAADGGVNPATTPRPAASPGTPIFLRVQSGLACSPHIEGGAYTGTDGSGRQVSGTLKLTMVSSPSSASWLGWGAYAGGAVLWYGPPEAVLGRANLAYVGGVIGTVDCRTGSGAFFGAGIVN